MRGRKSRETLWVGLGAGLLLVSGIVVLYRTGDVQPPSAGGAGSQLTSDSDSSPAPSCDFAQPGDDCTPPQVEDVDDINGARARFLAGTSRPSDLRFLLLSLEEWDSGVAPLLGPAEFRDGAEVPVYPALESATSGLTLAASWQQEWEFQQGILQEQIFLLDSAESAEKFVRQWSQYFSAAGLVSESSTVNGRAIVEVSYTDPAAQGFFANRRCAAQAVSQADSAVIVTTLFQGGDCTVLPKRVAAGVSAGLAEKVASVID